MNTVASSECPVTALSDTFHLSNEQLEAVFRKARSDSPVTFLPDIGFWAVTKFDDIKAILGDKEKFSSEITLEPLNPLYPEVQNLLKERGFTPHPTLSNNEREDHARIRKNVQVAFSPKRNKILAPYIRQLVNEAIDCFEACLNIIPEDPPSVEYRSRCIEYKFNSPGPEWDGITVMTEK